MDFLSLHDRDGCNLQIGGSDQWSNIIMGVDLIRRKRDRIAFGLTTPLMTNSAGQKMGKTVGGAVWLSQDLTPVSDFWQFWRNVEDVKVREFLCLFTELPIAEIDTIMSGDINDAKKRLASAVTTIVHGSRAARKVERDAEAAFGGDPNEMPLVTVDDTWTKPLSHLVATLMRISKSEGRRLITQKAVKIDGSAVDEDEVLEKLCRVEEPFLLHIGKRGRFRLIKRKVENEQKD